MIKKLLLSSFISSGSQGLYRLVILVLIFSHSLKDLEIFSKYSSLITMLIVFQSLGSMGILSSAITLLTKYQNDKKYNDILITFIFISIIFSLIFFLIAYIYVYKSGLEENPLYFSFITSLLIHVVFVKGYLNFKEQYLNLSLISIISCVFIGLVGFISSLNLFEIYTYAVIVESLLLIGLFLININIYEILKSKILLVNIFSILKFMIPISLAGFMIVPANAIIINFLNYFGETKELAIFNLGLQIRNILTFIPSVVAVIFLRQIFKNEKSNRVNFFISMLSIILIVIFIYFLKFFNFKYLNIISYSDIFFISISAFFYVLFIDKINLYMKDENVKSIVKIHFYWFLGFSIPYLLIFLYNIYVKDFLLSPFVILSIAYFSSLILAKFIK